MNDELPIFSGGWQTAKLRRKLRGADGIRIGPFGSALTLDQMVADRYKVYGQENVISDDFTAGSRYITPNKYAELKACSITSGDLLVTMMGTTGRCCVVPDDIQVGIMDSHLIRLRFQKEVDPDFMALLIDKGHYIREQIGATGKGTIMSGLNSAIIKDVWIGLPDLKAQRDLVRYVAEQTGKIDRLMDMRRRQMALLKEQRAALIQQAVTRGLNLNAPMKDSGLPWLGEIPKHWGLMPLRRRLREHRQGYYTTEPYQDKGVRLLRITDLRDSGRVDFSDSPFVENRSDITPFFLREFDFVFARTGGAGLFGMIETVGEPVAYASYLIRFRFDEAASPQFLRYFFLSRSFQETLKQNIHGGVNQNVHAEDIKNLLLTLPPASEQSEIVSFLNGEGSKFDALHAAYTRQLTLLAEYRAALIHECVTGQRTVPEATNA